MNILNLLTEAAAALTVIATISFLFQSEAIRGGGRVVLGFALGFIGAAVLKAVAMVNDTLLGGTVHLGGVTLQFDIPNVGVYETCGWIFVACGVATALFGARKFLRRNNAG